MKLLLGFRRPSRTSVRHLSRQTDLTSAGRANWPADQAFAAVPDAIQLTNGAVACRRAAVCSAGGEACTDFRTGNDVHVFVEFEVFSQIARPAFLLRLGDGHEQVLLRSLVMLQDGTGANDPVAAGQMIRVHHVLSADVPPGVWFLEVECISPATTMTIERHAELLEEGDVLVGCEKHCFARLNTLPVTVQPREMRRASTPSSIEVVPAPRRTPRCPVNHDDSFPTLLHITHWKAGSQWIYAILRQLFPDRIVPPQVGDYQVRRWPIQPGRVYPTVYSTRCELDRQLMPSSTRKFVVLRDLRDTLVSWYFSFKASHAVMTSRMARYRDVLSALSVEDGLLAMIEYQLHLAAEIQSSWAGGQEPTIKYEHLLEDTLGVMSRLLVEHFALPVSDEALCRAVEACRFEKVSGGRRAGEADPKSHYRKGIAGDWHTYFTPRVAEAFKARFGEVLIATGYERDLNW